MLRQFIKAITPEFILHARLKAKYNPRLIEMGITPKPAIPPVEFIGSSYGGYAINPVLVDAKSRIYSLGAGFDISFEEELAKRIGCHVHIYDPTPRSIAWLSDRLDNRNVLTKQFTVHPLGIWSGKSTLKFFAPKDASHVSYSLTNMQGTDEFIEVDCISLADAMAANGHDRIDLLKLNVEGAEYEIMHAAFDAGIRPRILMINYDEVHTQGDADAPQRLKTLANRIAELGYKVDFAELARVTYVMG